MQLKIILMSLASAVTVVGALALGWQSCLSAGNNEASYNYRVQTVATRWVTTQPQMLIVPNSIMCIPRSWGSRMPDDLTRCRALTTGNYRVPLLCNMQGCTIDHSAYNF